MKIRPSLRCGHLRPLTSSSVRLFLPKTAEEGFDPPVCAEKRDAGGLNSRERPRILETSATSRQKRK
jgi:hypothetical protein